jgi:hypothetical protein
MSTAVRLANVLLAGVLSIAALAGEATPQSMKLQGFLSDKAGGSPVPANGTFTMRFDLFASELGGALLATSGLIPVTVTEGLYEVELPFTAIGFEDPTRFIEITVDRDGAGPDPPETLSPRVKVTSAPFAYVAERLEGMAAAEFSEAVHEHSGDDVNTGVIDQEFVDNDLTRDSEVMSIVANADTWSNSAAFYCGADWSGNDVAPESADVVACLQAALASITTNEDGFDNTATVRLPDGYFDVSSACSGGECFELKSGIHIEGQMPRLRYIDFAPDLNMIPNGGSWLDPGPGNTLFTGQHLRGVVLERFGVMNFGKIASFGSDGENGIAFSTIRDVYGIGTNILVNPNTTVAWEFFNIQHLRMDHVKVYKAETGLRIVSQLGTWQPANSVITDFYVYTYPDPPAGILLEVLDPTVGDSRQMNYITFLRPQVNAFNSTGAPGSTGVLLRGQPNGGPVQYMSFIEADIEGEYETAIRLEQADHNALHIAAVTTPTVGLSIDADSEFNMISSLYDRLTVDVAADTRNSFSGFFDGIDDTKMHGLYYDRDENLWTASVGSGGRFNSGSGHLWYDDANKRWLVRDGVPGDMGDGDPVVTGTGAGASQGPTIWVDGGTSCGDACSNAGMTGCVDGWSGAATVGCSATAGRRICACR